MLYIHVARGIVARCTIVEYESWMDQREVWGRCRLRIIKEIEAFGIAFSREVMDHQSDMVRMKVEPDTFVQIRNHRRTSTLVREEEETTKANELRMVKRG